MTTDMEEAVGACRYDLWPKELKNATEPWTLVDVGANEGEFSAAAAHLAKLSGIHAFEPQPACRENLEKIMARVPGSQLHPATIHCPPTSKSVYSRSTCRAMNSLFYVVPSVSSNRPRPS